MTGVTASFGEHAEATRGSFVTIYAQNDVAGLEATRRWSSELLPFAESVRIKVSKLAGADWADILADDSSDQGFVEYKGEEAELLAPIDKAA